MNNLNNSKNLNDNFFDSSSEFLIIEDGTLKRVDAEIVNTTLNNASSTQGEKGEKGDPGITGRRGNIGNDGNRGDTGIKGSKGIKGFRGKNGVDGDVGVKGEKGQKGEPGLKGSRGHFGPDGPVGFIGDSGDDGSKGEKGKLGSRGPVGLRGLKGIKGEPGETLNGIAQRGDPGEIGDPGLFGIRGDRGSSGEVGFKGYKGLRGIKGDKGTPLGKLNHALYGAKSVRTWEQITISPGYYVHLSLFKNGDNASYKFFKLLLDIPSTEDFEEPSDQLVMILMNPGKISNFVPITYGTPPIVWIKSSEGGENTIFPLGTNTPRTLVLETHADGNHIGVYVPGDQTNINHLKVNFTITKMFGTNDL